MKNAHLRMGSLRFPYQSQIIPLAAILANILTL